MDVIRKIVQKRPRRGIELLLDGGETIRLRHPEAVVFGKNIAFVEDPDGNFDWFEAASVCKVRRLGRRTSSR